ncbi:hypothetical protein LBMAG42_04000 [Deltaproteobacteria bacterium]|nr:hypothetical protein LBMAG42_04000 [Deltaproteobacteria bacterium]
MSEPDAAPAPDSSLPEDLRPETRRKVLIELGLLWLATLLAIRLVVVIQKLGLPDVVLALVPFLFIYAPVWLCHWRKVDSYAYKIAIPAFDDLPAWGAALGLCARVVAVVVLPWLLGYHLYQNAVAALLDAVGPIRDVASAQAAWSALSSGRVDVLGPDPWATLTHTLLPAWRVPKDAWLLVPYHLFFVAIPEEFFYRGYMQTRLNEVFPRRWNVFGTYVGPGLIIGCLFFAFGHSLVTFRWWHFATFFPGLVFGWMRERTRSPVAGAMFHAWSNVTVTWLDTLYGIRV